MALISCPECGQQISDKAANCPQCGYPVYLYINEQKEDKEEDIKKVKCEYCGTMNEEKNTYCESCGANLHIAESVREEIELETVWETVEVAPVQNVIEHEFAQPKISEKQSKKLWEKDGFTILALILFPLIGVITMWYYKKFTPKKRWLILALILFSEILFEVLSASVWVEKIYMTVMMSSGFVGAPLILWFFMNLFLRRDIKTPLMALGIWFSLYFKFGYTVAVRL